MATITDGLYGYEIVILVLGVILFFVMLIALIQRLRNGTGLTALLPFFVLSIGMVGYSSVQSVTVGKDILTLQKATHELASSPTDSALRKTVQATVQKLEKRPIANAQNLTVVAAAQYVLGDDTAAKQNVQKALAVRPDLADAKTLQENLASDQKIANLTRQVETNPADTGARTSLATELKNVNTLQKANPNALTQLAKGQAAIGEYSQAMDNANKAVTIAPNGPARPLVNSLKQVMPQR